MFHDDQLDDLAKLMPEVCEEVTVIFAENDILTTWAIIDRNATKTPPVGYSNTLTQMHHELTFLRHDLGGRDIKRGNQVVFNNPMPTTYTIHTVYTDDAETITVAAR